MCIFKKASYNLPLKYNSLTLFASMEKIRSDNFWIDLVFIIFYIMKTYWTVHNTFYYTGTNHCIGFLYLWCSHHLVLYDIFLPKNKGNIEKYIFWDIKSSTVAMPKWAWFWHHSFRKHFALRNTIVILQVCWSTLTFYYNAFSFRLYSC